MEAVERHQPAQRQGTEPSQSEGPNLGLATTRELLEELRARIEIDYYSGGGGLDYTVVKGRPNSGIIDHSTAKRYHPNG
jgi:hypothetical protein